MVRAGRTTITLGVLLTAYAAVGWYASAAPKTAEPAKRFKPVQPLEQMMKGQQLLYKKIKDDLQDQAWDEAARAAWILAEIANVNHYQRDDDSYHRFADTMSSDCVSLAKTLKQRKRDAARELCNQIGRTCTACHDQFGEKKK